MKSAEIDLENLIAKKMKENDKLTYAEAMKLVSKQNPELIDKYLAMGRGERILPNSEDPGVKFLRIIGKKMEEDPSLTYVEAMNQAAKENPSLVKAYIESSREKKIYR